MSVESYASILIAAKQLSRGGASWTRAASYLMGGVIPRIPLLYSLAEDANGKQMKASP